MAQKTIVVRATPEDPIRKEMGCDAAIRPGQLVKYSSATSVAAASATIDTARRVVVESALTPVDGTYAAGDQVPFVVFKPGDEALLYATASALGTIVAGEFLVPDGAGFVSEVAAPVAGEKVAVALESATIAANGIGQVKCEVL